MLQFLLISACTARNIQDCKRDLLNSSEAALLDYRLQIDQLKEELRISTGIMLSQYDDTLMYAHKHVQR